MRASLRAWRLLAGIGREIGVVVCTLYIVVSTTAFVAPLALAVSLRPLVNGIAAHRTGQIVTGAVITALALLLTVLAPVGYRWATVRMRERSTMVVQRRLLTMAVSAPHLEHVEGPSFADRLQVLKRSSEKLADGMVLAVSGPVVMLQLAITAALLAGIQPVLLLLPLIAIPATWLGRRAQSILSAADLRAAEDRRRAQDLFDLAATPASGMELRVYGLRSELIERHWLASRARQRVTETALVRSAAGLAGSWLLFAGAYAGAVVLVLHEVAAGRATAGDVALALALAGAVVSATSELASLASTAMQVRTASEHYHWLHEQAAPHPAGPRAMPPGHLESGIELDRVSFSYPGSAVPALTGVSLKLTAGTVVAVVGENGAGKSTLVKLLCGMYAPTAGVIRVDGTDLGTLDIDAYRRRLTAGFQDFARFEFLVGEAVAVGDVPRLDDSGAVSAALAKIAGGFAARLPSGLRTQLGSSWAGGVDLSGGQWQKIALARAMMREAPLLSILDEPTAALDPQTEHELFQQIAADARRGRADGHITVLISHRFSTVQMADYIVVLNKGSVAEYGTHKELLARNGQYAELYRLQARAYA